MMLVCSNHSEVTDGGPCLQAFLTIEQYGLGGEDSCRSFQASRAKMKKESLATALKCQRCASLV